MTRPASVLVAASAALVAAALLGPVGAAAAADCSGAIAGDVDGDGYPDTVVGDPSADVGGVNAAGSIQVRYGAPGAGNQTLVQGATGVGETPEAGDNFGAAVVVALLDGDECADILVAAPGENSTTAANSGIVQVIFGSPSGAGAGRAGLVLQPGDAGLPGAPEVNGHFGAAIAVGQSADGGGRVLAVGAPGMSATAGAVWTVTIDEDGAPVAAREIVQGSAGIPATSVAGDAFGSAVDFGFLLGGSRDGYSQDLLVGVPGKSAGAGEVVAVADAGAAGPYTTLAFTQNSMNVDGTAEPGDAFGASLDVYMNPFTGARSIAIGAPGEDIGSAKDAGTAHLFRFPANMNADDEVSVSQNTKGVAGTAETGDDYGRVVEIRTVWDQAYTDALFVSAPKEDVGSAKDAGAVQVFLANDAVLSSHDVSLTRSTPGVPGLAATSERFGAAVGLSPKGDLAIGVPGDRARVTGTVVTLPIVLAFGRAKSGGGTWHPASGDRYGSALS